jgi:hypothetical protein
LTDYEWSVDKLDQLSKVKKSTLLKNAVIYDVPGKNLPGAVIICQKPLIYLCLMSTMDNLLGKKGKTSKMLTSKNISRGTKFEAISTTVISKYFDKLWIDKNIRVHKQNGWLSLSWVNYIWSDTKRANCKGTVWDPFVWRDNLHLHLTNGGWNVPNASTFVVPNSTNIIPTSLNTIHQSMVLPTTRTFPIDLTIPSIVVPRRIVPTYVGEVNNTTTHEKHIDVKELAKSCSTLSKRKRTWGWFFESTEWQSPIDDEYFQSSFRKWLISQSGLRYGPASKLDNLPNKEDMVQELSDSQ